MSGHSKWSTIKRQKGLADAKRSAIFGKLARQIAVAARDGKDPTTNFKLRLAIDRAKAINLPNDNIERAVRSGAGELRGQDLKEIMYEGFGPGHVALLIHTLTDNPNRTAGDIRSLLSKYGGSLGSSNSVAWMFVRRGSIRATDVPVGDQRSSLELGAIDAGAEDVVEEDGTLVFRTTPEQLQALRSWLEQQKVTIIEAEIAWIPTTTVAVADQFHQPLQALLEQLDQHDDITSISTNEA